MSAEARSVRAIGAVAVLAILAASFGAMREADAQTGPLKSGVLTDMSSLYADNAGPGSVDIGTRGRLVFRRVAVRAGIPDYGYAFRPEAAS